MVNGRAAVAVFASTIMMVVVVVSLHYGSDGPISLMDT